MLWGEENKSRIPMDEEILVCDSFGNYDVMVKRDDGWYFVNYEEEYMADGFTENDFDAWGAID